MKDKLFDIITDIIIALGGLAAAGALWIMFNIERICELWRAMM